MSPQRIAELLEAHSKDCGRHVPGTEIVDTVRNAVREINGHESAPWLLPKSNWPDYDPQKTFRIASRYWDFDLEKWHRESAVAPGEVTTGGALTEFFQGGEFITVGFKKNYFETFPFSRKAIAHAHRLPFVVLNPMKHYWGLKKDGKTRSAKCDSNVKERRVLVIEFDAEKFEIGSSDLAEFLHIQAALHAHLETWLPLVLITFSGNQSLHGTYATHLLPEEDLKLFMNEAVSIGADPALWVKSQFTRMPGGRDGRQSIHYFNPEVLYAPTP